MTSVVGSGLIERVTIPATSGPGEGGRVDAPAADPAREPKAAAGRLEGTVTGSGSAGLLNPGSISVVQEEGEPADQRDRQSSQDSGSAEAPETGEAADAAGAETEEDEGLDGLSAEEEELVKELRQRDAEVRRHEAAHQAVGGQYAGAASFTYQTGPDNRRYAIGGEVPIDASPIPGDPEATIRKFEQVRRAALAPGEPSGADRNVASQANAGIQRARAEAAALAAEERQAALEGDEAAPASEVAGESEENQNTPAASIFGQSADFEPNDASPAADRGKNASAFAVAASAYGAGGAGTQQTSAVNSNRLFDIAI